MKKLLLIFSLFCLTAKADDNPNRIKLLMGIGPTSVSVGQTDNIVTAQQTNGFVYGLSYDRKINNSRFSVGGQALSNGTVLLSVGVDF